MSSLYLCVGHIYPRNDNGNFLFWDALLLHAVRQVLGEGNEQIWGLLFVYLSKRFTTNILTRSICSQLSHVF